MTKTLLREKAEDLLDPISGDEQETEIKLELWLKLNEEFLETIADVDSWDKAELLQDILKLVESYFWVRAKMPRPLASGSPDNEKE